MKAITIFKNLLIFSTAGLITLFVGIIYTDKNPNYSFAQTPPPASEYADFVQCMGGELANYMNAIIEGKANGTIPANVHLLSPAFNMTSWTFGPITQAMQSNGAQFTSPHIEGIAGNLYHIGNTSIAQTYASNGIQSTFGSQPLFILETGCSNPTGNDYNGCHQNLANEYQELVDTGANVQAFIPFNPTNSNPQFSHHQMTDSQLQQLCNVQGCGTVGINYGTYFGTDTSQTGNLGLGYTVQIANDGNGSSVLNQINSSNGQTIIRIGVGEDGGGFTNPSSYIQYLADLGSSTTNDFYALAGPNEPDLEYWAFQKCVALFPEQALKMLQTCRGQLNIENKAYRTEIIGFNTVKPFVIEGAIREEHGSEKELAKFFGASLRVLVPSFNHPDFTNIKDKYIGSPDPASPLYLSESRTSIQNSNIPLFNMQMPYSDVPSGFGILAQSPQRKGESDDAYTKRVYGTTFTQGKQEYGLDEDVPVVSFNACIQRAGCDPAEENCFSGDNAGLIAKPDGTFCDPAVNQYCVEYYNPSFATGSDDDAEDYVTVGTLFSFKGEIVMEEPTALQAKGRVFEDIMAKSLVDIPGVNFNSKHGSTALFANSANTPEEALAVNNRLLEENQALASTIRNRQEMAATNKNSDISLIDSLSNPKEASAQATVADQLATGQFQTTTCEGGVGAALLVENKGSYYGVKAWDTQTVGTDGEQCEGLFDFAWEVDYFLNGSRVGGCGAQGDAIQAVVQSGAMPTYNTDPTCLENGACSERDIYGMSIDSMCPVPVTPADGELTVAFRVTHSNAPYHEGCSQTAQCLCDGDKCKVDKEDQFKNVDCRVCPAWAPPSLCSKMVAQNIVNKTQCVDGSCIAESEKLIESNLPFNFDSSWDISPSSWGAWLLSFLPSPISPSRLKCEKKSAFTEPDGTRHNAEYKCTYNTTNYHVYMYPTQIIADNSLNNLHMRLNDYMFNIPGYTNKYFDPEPAKAPMNIKLSIEDFFTKNEDGESLDQASSFNADDFSHTGAGDDFVYLGISANEGSTRTISVEYPNFIQPISSGYCLNQMFLTPKISEDKQVPITTAQSGLCTMDFMPGSLAYRRNELAQKYPTILARFDNNIFDQSTDALEANQVINSKTTNRETAKITTKAGVDPEYDKKVRAYINGLTSEQKAQFKLEVMTDIYTITGKNWHLRDKNNPDYVPPEMEKDLERLKKKYDAKMGI